MRALFWWVSVTVLWSLVLCSGCGSEKPTRVLVAIHTDLTAGSELSSVKLQTYKADGSGEVVDAKTFRVAEGLAEKGEVRPPFTQGVRKGKDSTFLLVVTGYGRLDGRPEAVVASYKARISYTEGKDVLHKVFLGRACHDQLCSADAACYARGEKGASPGVCQDILHFENLPVVVRGQELEPLAAPAATDAGTEDSIDRATAGSGTETAAEDAGTDAESDGAESDGAEPDGSETEQPGLACEADNSCPACRLAAECPAPEAECMQAACSSDGRCSAVPKAANAECSAGVCDGNGLCVACTAESQCSADKPFCVGGACQQCRSHADCSASDYEACEGGTCVVQPFCGDGEVGPGEACDPKAEGWNEWTCSDRCRPQTAYTPCHGWGDESEDCDGFCVFGVCVPGCERDEDCPEPPVGLGVEVRCRAGQGCFPHCPSGTNEQCAPGLVCRQYSGEEVPRCGSCTSSALCSPGLSCVATVSWGDDEYGRCE